MQLSRLSLSEGAGHNGANFVASVLETDLTTATANTAQALTLCSITPTGDAIVGGTNFTAKLVDVHLVIPFEDTTDTAFNDLQVSVDDSSNVARFLAAIQINKNGTKVVAPTPTANAITAAATSITATFTPAGGKNVLQCNKGRIDFYFFISDAAL